MSSAYGSSYRRNITSALRLCGSLVKSISGTRKGKNINGARQFKGNIEVERFSGRSLGKNIKSATRLTGNSMVVSACGRTKGKNAKSAW